MTSKVTNRPKFDEKTKTKIYEKTDGYCHICHKKIAKRNYGVLGSRGAWEIDHSKPISKGGKNHLNNYLPACISCNRKKSNSTTRSARSAHQVTTAPTSKQNKTELKRKRILGRAGVGALIGLRFGPVGSVLGALAGAFTGANS